MGLPTSLTDLAASIVADTSAIINLNATGCAERIIRALPVKFLVTDVVPGELEEGRRRGRRDADLLDELVASGAVEIVKLDELSANHFEGLVVGPAISTLDDGEAATIAYAAVHKGIAVIDENKATRICGEMFPSMHACCTVDILNLPEVREALGEIALAEAVCQALVGGRMKVFPQHVEWVVGLIGNDRAVGCRSLPASARRLTELRDAPKSASSPI